MQRKIRRMREVHTDVGQFNINQNKGEEYNLFSIMKKENEK